jgi:hypothetical protein
MTNSITDTKTCYHCGQSKRLTEFQTDRTQPDGRQKWCKTCRREYKTRYNRSGSGRCYEPDPKYTSGYDPPARFINSVAVTKCSVCGESIFNVPNYLVGMPGLVCRKCGAEG